MILTDEVECWNLEDDICCEGTAIVHVDGAVECTDDPRCDLPALVHEHQSRCEDVTCCEW